jgi:hypothetical protein
MREVRRIHPVEGVGFNWGSIVLAMIELEAEL